MLLGIGIITGIIVQALFNISVVISILPAKGIPLPFISYGGSSVIVTLVARRDIAEYFASIAGRSRGTQAVISERRVRRATNAEGCGEPVEIMKVLIAAGGTGGHIYPGIAVAKEIMRRDAESEVLFVGTARGLETKIVPENGFQLSLIDSAGLKNVGLAGKIKGLAVLPKSFLEARRIIRRVSARRCGRCGRICFRAGAVDGGDHGRADAGDGLKRVAGIYKSAAREVCRQGGVDV